MFFDEAGDIPPSVQVKLLRVLEQHEVTPVGDARPRPSSVSRDRRHQSRPAARVSTVRLAAGAFRQDLYFRLAVFEIALPPLRAGPRTFRCWPSGFCNVWTATTGASERF